MIGLLVTIFLARRGIGLAKDEANTVSSAPDPNPIFRIATAPDFRRRLGVDSSWPARDIFSFGQVAKETSARLRNPVIALFGALIFVHLLTIGEERASTRILGDALAAGTGDLWIYFAGFLGALGSFFSGSNTISNLTFGPIQLRIAQDLGVSSTTMLALQTVGAAMGNMVAVHNIVAVCAVLGLKNQEGAILKKTFIPTLVYGIILAVLAGIWFAVS